MPSTPSVVNPTVSRRRVLAAGGLATVIALATPACGSAPAPSAVDELESQQQLALGDSRLAAAAAAVAPPALAPALTVVAAERAEHARALAVEIARVAGKPEPAPTSTETSTETSASSAAAEADAPAPTVPDVVNALRAAADSAGKQAVAASGYRAGLLASIAAACTAAYTVALVTPA